MAACPYTVTPPRAIPGPGGQGPALGRAREHRGVGGTKTWDKEEKQEGPRRRKQGRVHGKDQSRWEERGQPTGSYPGSSP